LHSITSNYFPEFNYMFMMANWTFLTNHAWALLCIAHDPEVLLRDIAARRSRRGGGSADAF